MKLYCLFFFANSIIVTSIPENDFIFPKSSASIKGIDESESYSCPIEVINF